MIHFIPQFTGYVIYGPWREIARSPVIWMALHASGIDGWLHNHEPVRASDYVFIYQSPRCVIPFKSYTKCLLASLSYLNFKFKQQHPFIIHLTSNWYLTSCCWICATMVALVFWIACTRGGCTCCIVMKASIIHNSWAMSGSIEKWNHEL